MRSVSQKKIKGIIENKNQYKVIKDSEYLGTANKGMTVGSMKNLIKIRNKSSQSSQRDRQHGENSLTKRTSFNKKQRRAQDAIQANPLITGPFSHKSILQIQVTPHKLKLDVPQTTNFSKQATINKTIQQLSNEAADNLMLNIKFGKVQENISYKSFLKKEVVPSPVDIIKKLEDWLNKYKIKSGIIYTKNLHTIFSRKMVSNHMILAQFANYSQLRKQMQGSLPGLQYYPQLNYQKGRQLAATKIQSLFKMNFDIKYTKKLKSLMNKVKVIQRQWRISLMTKRCRQKIMARINMKIEMVKTLTNGMIKNWQLIRTSPRVQVHISSIALEQFKRLSITDLQHRQIAQIGRIFKAAQADCTIIFVTPLSFVGEILRYYQRVFSFGNRADSFRDRLYFISVENMLNRISSHMTTVSALLYDFESLSRIKQIIKNRQNPVMGQVCAYIIPSYPSNQYINLSSELQIPILSGPQSLCKLYSTKSGHYQLLYPLTQSLAQKTPFIFPKTVHSIYSQKQLITTLAVLIHKHKQVKKWMLKIDDEVNGRGLAFLNVDGLGFLKQLRKRDQSNQQEGITDKDLIGLIVDELNAKFKIRLKIINKKVYPDYDSYMSHYLTRGGFVQACIEPVTQSQKTYRPIEHSISFKVQPNGQFQIKSTYSRLELGYKSINSSIQSPSLVPPQRIDNQRIVRALYRHLWAKCKMFGYFTIDLLVLQHNTQSQGSNVYVIGFDCFMNQKVAGLFVPILTSNVQFIKEKNKFIANKPTQTQVKANYQNLTQRSLTEQSQKVSASTLQISKIKQPQKIKQLYFIYCPFLKLNNIPPMIQFFKMCKFANISFDLQLKTGTLFLLQGGTQSGCLGFICVSNSREGVRQEGLKLVEFLSREFRQEGGKLKGKESKGIGKGKRSCQEIGQLRGYLQNEIKKQNAHSTNMRREDLNLQMIF